MEPMEILQNSWLNIVYCQQWLSSYLLIGQ